MATDTTNTTMATVPEAEETSPEWVQEREAGAAELEQARAAEGEGLTTGQKVGVAAGVTVAAGLAGFGIYKLGDRFGWWNRGGGLIIDDEPLPPDAPPQPSGGGSKRAQGRPPNISGDPAGYNTTQFPGPGPIRLAMLSQGYKVSANDRPLNPDDESNPHVMKLQSDWNKVIRGLDSGRVKLPKGASQPKLFKHFKGILKVDGIPGKNTLNALEIILTNYTKNALFWNKLRSQAR